jgi:sugar lactone lactonase YvrE
VDTPYSVAAEIVTIAGTGKEGYSGDGGPALKADLNQPFGIEFAPDGSLYFCDFLNHIVRRIDSKTNTISTVAGTGQKTGHTGDGGPATQALLHEPHELRFDRQGNYYVTDTKSNAIRRVDAKTGIITTVAGTSIAGFSGDGGPATKAQLDLPIAVSLDGESGLLICDIKNHRVRKVDFASGNISTLAGTGERKEATDGGSLSNTPVFGPRSLAVEGNGNLVLILREGNAVYRIDRKSMTIHRLAGTGKQGFSGDGGDARKAMLAGPKGVAVDKGGNILLCDTENHAIRILHKSTGTIDTLIGDAKQGDGPDGDPRKCRLNRPHGIFIDREGAIYIGDSGNHKIRKFVR